MPQCLGTTAEPKAEEHRVTRNGAERFRESLYLLRSQSTDKDFYTNIHGTPTHGTFR